MAGFKGAHDIYNGVYTLQRELPFDSTYNCALNPIYVGPENNGTVPVLISSRPTGYLNDGMPAWFIVPYNSSLSLDHILLKILLDLTEVAIDANEQFLLFQTYLVQHAITAYFTSVSNAYSIWEMTDLTRQLSLLHFVSFLGVSELPVFASGVSCS